MNDFAKRALGRLGRDEQGATAVEYGLIVALVVLAMVGALTQVAGSTINMWVEVEQNVARVS